MNAHERVRGPRPAPVDSRPAPVDPWPDPFDACLDPCTPGVIPDDPNDPVDQRAFLVRDAVAPGKGQKYFRHPRWERPFHGVRTKDPPAATLFGRALQYLPRLREGEHFSHATSLALLGCPVRVPVGQPVEVSSPERLGRVTCRGVKGHRFRVEPRVYQCRVPGRNLPIPVSAPLDAVRQSALALPFPELVVAIDHLLLCDPHRYDDRLRVSPDKLADFSAGVTGRGAVRFREAALLARVGAESRMETLTRLAQVCAGMRAGELQVNLHDSGGRWIGRFDLVDYETRSIYEYDGEQHLMSRAQRRRDSQKLQAARDEGWRVMLLHHEDVLEGLHAAGTKMLGFAGAIPNTVRPALARLLDEEVKVATESAIPLVRARDRRVAPGRGAP